jgi:hypothetical protein
MDEDGLALDGMRGEESDITQAKVLYFYQANEEDELTVQSGAIVNIINMDEQGWWQCEYDGDIGMLPSNYLRVLGDEDSLENRQQREPSDGGNDNELGSPKPYPISESDLPRGWKMFVDKESGDIYYFNEKTGRLSTPFLP